MKKLELDVVVGTAMETWMLQMFISNLKTTLQVAESADEEQLKILRLQIDSLLNGLESSGNKIMAGLAGVHALSEKGKRFVNNDKNLADYTSRFEKYVGSLWSDAALESITSGLAKYSK